jgi:DNA topoisomerase-2
MKIADFIDSQFREYANYDNDRSLPHIMDGLKTTQRKALHAFVEHIGHGTIVCDKAGMRAAEVTKYKHGATSMIGVLINMNQDFPGSNNMPLFDKEGQFGTRLNHKASSERYISTKLGDTFKTMFDPEDNFILENQFDQGDKIEPLFYLPKLPMLLINGSDGTGNGYASTVLQYDAKDVKTAVEEVLKTGVVQTPLTPYLNGYYGAISKDHASGQVTFEGQIERVGANKIIIHELTPNRQLADYKAILNALVVDKTGPNKDLPPMIKDYDNESTEDEWKFVLDVPRSTMQLTDDELLLKLKLIERQTENLTVWLPNGKLKRFSSVEMLIQEWVQLRLEYYEMRRRNQIVRLKADLDWLVTKANFIRWWNKESSSMVTLKKEAMKDCIRLSVTKNEDYIDRLLSIRISNLGLEEVETLMKELEKAEAKVKTLEGTTNKKMMSSEVKALKLD